MKLPIKSLTAFLGIQMPAAPTEKILSAVGGVVSIYLIFFVSQWATDLQGAASILPSMGAATVLLFGVPSGPLSQPWALFAGNLLSAFIGVLCYQWIDHIVIAASVAVGLSIGLMFVFRCVHPPGGATALAAVIGGDAIYELGFYYVLTPTLINCCIIFSVAFLFNNLFGWRRYPVSLTPKIKTKETSITSRRPQKQHIQQALQQFIKNNPEKNQLLSAETIKQILDESYLYSQYDDNNRHSLIQDAHYSNGENSFDWSVRKIVDLIPHQDPSHNLVLYRVIDGKNKLRSDSCTFDQFNEWAKFRLK